MYSQPVQPAVAPPNPPDHIVFAFTQVVRDVTAPRLLERREVEFFDPVFADEAEQQVFNDDGVREDQLVAGIRSGVGSHGRRVCGAAQASVRLVT